MNIGKRRNNSNSRLIFVLSLAYEWNNRSAHYDEFEKNQNYEISHPIQCEINNVKTNVFLCISLISR